MKKYDTEKFIQIVKHKHGNKFDINLLINF